MRFKLTLLLLFSANCLFGQTKYEKDFLEFWQDVQENYAYLSEQPINWPKVKEIYWPQAKQIRNDHDFIRLLENVISELHNGHISLNTNLRSSNRLIPSGQDLFATQQQHTFFISDIRKGSAADLSGLKIGDEILLFNDKPVAEQLIRFMPKSATTITAAMQQYALNMLLAGTHDVKRKISVRRGAEQLTYYPDSINLPKNDLLISTQIINKNTAYIRFNNSLGNYATIADFDKALDSLMAYKNLVLDLTETPSGGNTTVARSLMGRFITKSMPYQQHEFDEAAFQTKRQWVEYVPARKSTYKGKVFIMVGHWTGSMGEGIAIGFDAMKRATVIGTPMAKLLGAISSFQLTETKIGFQLPTERLYHINGTPREHYIPKILTQNTEQTWAKVRGIK